MPEQYNPESILQEQFESQRQQIQKHFQTKWDEVNNRARAGLFKSQKERDGAFFEIRTEATQTLDKFTQKVEQATGQFQQIDKLAEMGAIKDPDEVKWRMVLGPEAEKAMFQEQRDPRLEHRDILYEENRLLGDVQRFTRGRDGRLYQAKIDSKGYYSDQPDRSKPASQDEIQLWTASVGALDQLEQQKIGVVQQMADAGIPNPNRLQDLMVSREKESFFKKLGKGIYGISGPGLVHKSVKRIKAEFGAEPSGTFAQKVQRDVAPVGAQPQTQAPQAGKKLTKKVAMNYLLQYPNRQDAMAAARADGYTE